MRIPNEDIIIGRTPERVKKIGRKGTILLGKSYYETPDALVPASNVYLDVADAHVFLITGKRGSGKSYTLGVIAEGFRLLEEEIRKNLSMILVDTMGIYWTMGHANLKEKDLLEPYGLEPIAVPLRIFTPEKYYHIYREKGIRTDEPFSLTFHEITSEDWIKAFQIGTYSPEGILISKIIDELQTRENVEYTFEDVLHAIRSDKESTLETRNAVISMFKTARGWGCFSNKGTPIESLARGGEISVLDVSCYVTMPGGSAVKSLVIGIVSKHLFEQRMEYRKEEELEEIKETEAYFKTPTPKKEPKLPLVWLVIDEAHEFLPRLREDESAATAPLVSILREGRQPGISLVLATQQPGKIHEDVMTQSDLVLSHRITAQLDVKALGLLAQSYMEAGIERAMNRLPRVKGAAVLFDDSNERIYQMRVRPRLSWHGGGNPSAVKED
ncbi:ATP-binding protein [Candidatus Woesearchaeota archaeon]|nr:MAG: ATP-binding protein [Candidatus Woesearchaeota archaeon]